MRRVLTLATAVAVVAAPAAAQPRPTVDDPLLAPPAPAPRTVASWDEARALLAATPERARATADVARADALGRAAAATRWPTVAATASVAIDLLHPGTAPGIPATATVTPTAPLGTAAVAAILPLYDAPARRERTAAAAERRGAAAGREDVERRTLARAAAAAAAVLATARLAELARDGLGLALERAALGARSFELGAATELDAIRTRQDVAVARAAVVSADEQLRVAREALGLALGLDGEVGLGDGLDAAALVAAVRAQCRPLAPGEARADRVAAAADVEAARARQAAVAATALPAVELASSVSGYTADPAPGRIPAWSLAVVLRVPIWDGGRRAAAVAQRAAAVADAVAVDAQLTRVAAVEGARARRGGEVAAALVDAAREARDLAVRIDAMTRRGFEIGRATSLELVQTAAVLRQAELTLAVREAEAVAAELAALLTEARCVP
jgi:outer membrane protein TolC